MKIPQKLYFFPILVLLVVVFTAVVVFRLGSFPIRAFGGGDGTEVNPYQIIDCQSLQDISNNLSAYYVLSDDINCDSFNWSPIGTNTSTDAFSGNLNGNNKTISNITITKGDSDTGSYLGIFGTIEGGTVYDLNIVNIDIYAPKYDYVGGLAGEAGYGTGNSAISNVDVSGDVHGNTNVGGLVGMVNGTALTGCSSSVNVSGAGNLGGLVGEADTDIVDSSSSGTITGGLSATSFLNENIGGLVGSALQNVTNSFSTSPIVSGGNSTGGLIGYANGSAGTSVSGCHATGDITVTGDKVGGLVGWNYTQISNSYSTGTLNITGYAVGGLTGVANGDIHTSHATGDVIATGEDGCVGGLVGDGYSNIYQSYALGNVSGTKLIGGLAGENDGAITNSFAKGSITSSAGDAGGLVGDAMGVVSNSYSVGAVSSQGDYTGGLVGWTNSGVNSSYYNSETTSQTDSDRGTPKTTLELKDQSTFSSWDFATIWNIISGENDGYPINYEATSSYSDVATVLSSVYTVSSGGTTNESITNIPFGTSKDDFLANISKGENNQTWNTGDISSTVVTGDTLVVTAEDGVTVVTYTLTVTQSASTVATVTSSTYTVNTTGSTGTITNVPANTSKTTLIANIQKGNSAQTWNTNNIANPVVTGNTLVVTAEDGTTVVTYTITVNENTDGREDLAPTRMYYSGPNNWGVQNTKFTVSGDFNNDGKDDVAAMYDYGNGKMGIWVFQSNGTSMTPVSMYMGVDGGWNVSATRYVVSGDFNNDGKEDIAAMYDYGNGFMGIWAFLSDGTHLTPTRIYTGVPGGWNVSATKFVVSGDFNNDGKEDIGAMYDYGNGFMGIWAFESDGTNLSPVRIYTGVPGGWNVSATRYVVSGDFNNDGKEDIAAMYDYGGGFMGIWAFESDGTNLSPVRIYTGVPGGWNVSATKFVVSGDFNNDGKEDIGAMYDYGNGFMGIWAFESDGTNLSPVRIYTGVPGGWNVDATTFLVSGDFDGDTYTDVGAMYNYGSNNMGVWIFK